MQTIYLDLAQKNAVLPDDTDANSIEHGTEITICTTGE